MNWSAWADEELALLDALAKRQALGGDDLLELVVELLAGPRLAGLVEIADSALALPGERRARGEREFAAALVVKLLELRDPALLLGVAVDQLGELVDLEAGEIPVAGVDAAAGLLVLVEHEAGERRFGARDVGADVANDQRDIIGMPLGAKRARARRWRT